MVNYHLKSFWKSVHLEVGDINSKLACLIIENQFVESLRFDIVLVSEPLLITPEELLESPEIY